MVSKIGNRFRSRDATPPWHVSMTTRLALADFGRIWSIISLSAMVFDGPVLALSDIMHGIASSPAASAPQDDDTDKNTRADSATPEPLDYAQIEDMRKRVLELIVSGASKMSSPSREKELMEMVCLVPCLSVIGG